MGWDCEALALRLFNSNRERMMDEMRTRRMHGECLFMNQFPIGLQLEVAAVVGWRWITAETAEKFACASNRRLSSSTNKWILNSTRISVQCSTPAYICINALRVWSFISRAFPSHRFPRWQHFKAWIILALVICGVSTLSLDIAPALNTLKRMQMKLFPLSTLFSIWFPWDGVWVGGGGDMHYQWSISVIIHIVSSCTCFVVWEKSERESMEICGLW